VTGNSVSSSTLKPPSFNHYGGVVEILKLHSVTLPFLLEKFNIQAIDLYVSDLQGLDFAILESVKEFLDQKRIMELFVETHNGAREIYLDAKNSLVDFWQMLRLCYRIDYISHDGRILNSVNDIFSFSMGTSFGECDVHWSLHDSDGVKFLLR
jgi:hypothetical protein